MMVTKGGISTAILFFGLTTFAYAIPPPVSYGTWQIVHNYGSAQIISPQGATTAASPYQENGSGFGTDAFGMPTGNLPAGASGMELSFTFTSTNFFANEPDAHVAVGVTAKWNKANLSGNNGLLEGRGVIFGNVEGAPNGCASGPSAEIESWRKDGTILLYQGSCSVRLLTDNTAYTVIIEADKTGDVYYSVHAGSNIIGSYSLVDSTNLIDSGLGGWFILFVFADQTKIQAESNWTLTFSNVTVSYY
ncbi:MAG: hypothetical protein ACREPN_09160 [Rudaea sp.]